MYDAESVAALSPWHAMSLRICRRSSKTVLDWAHEICGALKKELKDKERKAGVERSVSF
jgi:hypothetical protein